MENELAQILLAVGAGICLIELGFAVIIVGVKDKKGEE